MYFKACDVCLLMNQCLAHYVLTFNHSTSRFATVQHRLRIWSYISTGSNSFTTLSDMACEMVNLLRFTFIYPFGEIYTMIQLFRIFILNRTHRKAYFTLVQPFPICKNARLKFFYLMEEIAWRYLA